MNSKITITIRSIDWVEAQTSIDAQAWSYASAAQRVLMLHDRLRKVTKGQPFEIISQLTNQGLSPGKDTK